MASEREEGGDRGPVCGVPGKCKNNNLIFKYVSGDIKDFLDNLFFWVFPKGAWWLGGNPYWKIFFFFFKASQITSSFPWGGKSPPQ